MYTVHLFKRWVICICIHVQQLKLIGVSLSEPHTYVKLGDCLIIDIIYIYIWYVIPYNAPHSILACFVEIQLVRMCSEFIVQLVACIIDSTGASSSASVRDLAEKREERLSCRRERESPLCIRDCVEPVVLPSCFSTVEKQLFLLYKPLVCTYKCKTCTTTHMHHNNNNCPH